MSRIKVKDMDLMFMFSIYFSNGDKSPSFEGNVVAVAGDDISHIEEIMSSVVDEGDLVYFDEGVQRNFAIPADSVSYI